MGTPELAARIFERLLDDTPQGFSVVAAVTRPDQPRGRGMRPQPSEVGAVAERYAIPVLKPSKIRTPEFLAELKAFDPDLIVVAAYGRILPRAILDAPRIMPINVHASLLPRHRGAAPIEGAILAGDAETGVTIMRVTEQMDAGAMLHKRAIPIDPGETQGTLKAKLAELGADALLEALAMLDRGELIETPQDEALATYTKPIQKADAVIDWNASAAFIERMTRAYDPWPVARTTIGADEMLLWRAHVADPGAKGEPGTIVSVKPNPVVQCGEGLLELLEVQAPGRKRMGAADFARGKRIAAGHKMGS